MNQDKESKRKKALKLLTKLVKAAHKAQETGKYVALEKIITEANKLSSKLEKTNKTHFVAVEGEIVDEPHAVVIIDDDEEKKSSKEEEIFTKTQADLKAEHNNLAIIAAKRDFLF